LDIVQLYEHIIGIYRKSGREGEESGSEEGGEMEGRKKGWGEKKCKEAKVR